MKKEDNKVKKETRNSKALLMKIVTALLGVLLVVYLIFNTVNLMMSPADTFMVEEGVLNLKETADAYVIRNEVVLQGNNYKNGMERVITEGKRVAKGEPVFHYYVNGENTIKNEIAEIDKKIAEAQKNLNPNLSYTTDIEVLKNRIKALEEKVYQTNNVEEISNYKKEMEEYSYKILTILGNQPDSYLKELFDQKTACMKKLTDGAEEVISDYSGTVSYRVDNLENIFTTTDFSYLKKSFLDGLNLKSGQLIETNNEKGKVITEFSSYLAIEMNSDAAKNAKVGDKVKIELDVENRFNAEIVAINEDTDCRIIIFKVNDLPEKLINYRKVSLNIIWWESTGLKIPKAAIIEENGRKYVERNRSGYSVKVLIKVLKENDSYAIVDKYTNEELQEMGYSMEEIQNIYILKQYDKINIPEK